MPYVYIFLMGSTWINSSCDFTVGSGISLGYLGLVERTHFLDWVRWPWSDSAYTGKYFEALA